MGEITLPQRLTLLLDASPLNDSAMALGAFTGGTLLDGLAIFILGVAMPLIIAVFHLTPDVVGLIGASLVFGAVFGAGLGGPMANHFGRKPLMLADMIIICAGAAASALAKGPAMLFIGQFLVGDLPHGRCLPVEFELAHPFHVHRIYSVQRANERRT